MQRPRARWLDVPIQLFAIIGALTSLRSIIAVSRSHARAPIASGVIEYFDGHPAAGVPIFLDRGGLIERYTSDSVGRYRLPLTRFGRGEAWLMCPHDALPSVGYAGQTADNSSHIELNTRDIRAGVRVPVRGFGWSAPVPRECIYADSSIYWRGPVDSAAQAVPAAPHEPEWGAPNARP